MRPKVTITMSDAAKEWLRKVRQNETTSTDICPACGARGGNRVGGEPSRQEESGNRGGDIHSDAGTGPEPGDGPDEDAIRWFHYIPLSEWEEWEKIGWKLSRIGHPPHDDYSVLGEWCGEGPAVRPMVAQLGATSSPSSSLAPGPETSQQLPPLGQSVGSLHLRPRKRRKSANKPSRSRGVATPRK